MDRLKELEARRKKFLSRWNTLVDEGKHEEAEKVFKELEAIEAEITTEEKRLGIGDPAKTGKDNPLN